MYRILLLIIFSHLLTTVVANEESSAEYIGCFQAAAADTGQFVLPLFPLTLETVFDGCELAASNNGSTVFGIYNEHYCMTSASADSDYNLHGPSSGCYETWTSGKEYHAGDEGSVAVYQIVERHVLHLSESDFLSNSSSSSAYHLSCPDTNPREEESLNLFVVGATTSSCDLHEDLVGEVMDLCHGMTECSLDFWDFFTDFCPSFTLTITYGCQYGFKSQGKSDKWKVLSFISEYMWDAFVFISVFATVLFAYQRRERIRSSYPEVRECCWELHRHCPCLAIYPRDATGPHYGNENNTPRIPNVHTLTTQPMDYRAPVTSPPTSTYPPTSTHPPPATTTANVPDTPPPTYGDISGDGAVRRSGGWFTSR